MFIVAEMHAAIIEISAFLAAVCFNGKDFLHLLLSVLVLLLLLLLRHLLLSWLILNHLLYASHGLSLSLLLWLWLWLLKLLRMLNARSCEEGLTCLG